MEIKALELIRENISIPVPNIYAWGSEDGNPLGIGRTSPEIVTNVQFD